MQVDEIQVVTFDCYGTLIDWDGGIGAAIRSVPSLEGCDHARILTDRERLEHELLAGPYRPYSEVLGESLRRAAAEQAREVPDAQLVHFAATMGMWPPFGDSREALRRLASRFRLAILSNVESATLERSVALLGCDFDELVTAEAIESYKPARKHFDEGRRRLALESDALLHVAGSLYHDVRPAQELGITAVWINRRDEVVPEDLSTDRVFPDLRSVADALGV